MKRKITCLLAALLLMSGLTWAQTDVLDHDVIGVSGNSYSSWTGLTLTSGAVYAGNTAGGNNAIQMRSSNSNSGIVTTTSAGMVTNITVAWNSNTADGRALNVYGSNSAYEAASDLYGSNAGTLIGTIAKGTTDLEITDDYAFIGIRSASGALYLDEIQITWSEGSGVTPPSITASNVEIEYNVDGDEIEYLINNPVDGGVLTASTTSDWLTLGEVEGTIPFTCTINQTAAARTATVTLTYTYNTDQTVTKNVTVTQTGNPNVVDNISDINATGAYTVQGTIVAKSQRGFIVGDGTGYVYYYNQNYTQADYNIGDVVKLSGNVVVYGGVYEFNNTATITAATESNYQAEDPTVLTGADMDARVASTTPPQLSNYVQYEGTLTVSGTHYNITNITGATTAIGSISYPLDTEFASLDGKHVKVSGYYVGISSSTYYNTIIGSVEEVVSTEPSITITPATVNLDAGEHYLNLLDLAYENIEVEGPSSFTVHYYNAEGDEIELVQGEAWLVAGVVMEDDVYQVLYVVVANYGEARTAYFRVSCGETYSNLVTVTQAAPVLDYAVLPFVWEGGSSADFAALNGVTLSGNGSDYNSNHAPYLIKFDGTGDYIQVKTDGQPGVVTIGVKMIGGSNTSTITIQGSVDGETFTDIEELTISGAQNDILTLETTNAFDANDRYVRMLFTKGSNVGVGPITIAKGTAPSINVAPATFDLEAVGDLNGMHVASSFVTYNNIDITQASDFHFQFYNAEGVEQDQPEWILGAAVSQIANSYQAACMVGPNTGAARSTYYKIYALGADSNPVYSNLVTINQAGVPQPSIIITPDNFELDANSHMAEVLAPITYQNIVVVSGSGNETFDVQYYDAEGHEIEQTWCSVGAAAEGDTDFNLIIVAGVNEGNEARTAYFKLSAHDADSNLVYSNLVTVTQAAPVIDYAVLPFVWEGGSSADFAALNGVTLSGNGSDYNSNHAPYLIKLDGTGDYIQVKTDSQPGTVTIGVKMIGGSNTSTITIQGSADGETFSDIEVLTISGAQNDTLTLETTNAFADADRYVRMLFTKGSNVGVGPITIASGSASSITVTPATLNLEAVGTMPNGVQMQQFVVTYQNLDIEGYDDFAVQFYDAEGEEQEQPTWITPNPAYVAGGNEVGYMVMLFIEGNTGVARSAYFKVYALGEEDYVYSNLVTINQAGVAQQYTLTVEPFENLEIFTFVGGDESEMALEGAGSVQVAAGDNVMLSISALEGYEIASLMVDGEEHVQDIDESMVYLFDMPNHDVTINATAVEITPVTYTLATTIESGKTYIIVGSKTIDEETSYYAMGEQRNNNRGGVAISADGTTATVASADVYEFVITALEDGFYSIYDDRTPGYLYAAAAGSNHLKTEPELDTVGNGNWEISIDEEGLFSIVASQSNNRNVMQFNYNGGSPLFSCYGSASQSPVYLYVKDETPSVVTQTIALATGVNWVSFNAEITLDDLKAALVATGNTTIEIKSKLNGSTTYNGSRWRGTLNTLDVAQMYRVKVGSDCEIVLEGMPVEPAEHPVTINPGANWIAFPLDMNMTVANAFAGFAVNGDNVKAKLDGSTTYNGSRWRGTLSNLVPGQGYVYTSAASESRTFVFPAPSKQTK